jgi:hypothetical protein
LTERALTPSSPSSVPPAAARPADAVDPELAALPDPPRGERRATLALLAVTAVASMAMALGLARDAAYAFAPGSVAELGDLRTAPAGSLAANTHVRAHGMLGAAGSIRFERALESDSFRLAPVAGRPDVWVELRVPEGIDPGRYVPPTSFAGRLVRFDAAGTRHRGLAGSVKELGQAVPGGAWLLVDGEAPESARWAVALVVMFAGFAAWNAVAIARLVKKVR